MQDRKDDRQESESRIRTFTSVDPSEFKSKAPECPECKTVMSSSGDNWICHYCGRNKRKVLRSLRKNFSGPICCEEIMYSKGACWYCHKCGRWESKIKRRKPSEAK